MKTKNFTRLVRWELEEYLSLPVLAFIVASAVISVLFQNPNPSISGGYIKLYSGSGLVLFVLALVAGAFFSRSYAGSIGRGETKLLLSYPIRRWHVFLSKFVALFTTIFVAYGVAYSLNLYFYGLSLFEPMFYLTLFAFLLQLMLACGVAIAVSMVTKNEIMSMMASLLLLLGVDNMSGIPSYFSAKGSFKTLFQYFSEQIYDFLPFGEEFIVTFDDAVMAVSVPISIFVLLFILSFVYFTRFMEID
jgi:ABC-type transport system involved in multi-copper enzyme maturation permease subunit